MKKIHRDIVSALIFSSDEKLFMGMKDPQGGGVYFDCWHIPGGGIDEGEDKKQALIREIKEETGLNISNCKIELVDDKGKGVSTRKLKDSGEIAECEMTFYVYRVDIDEDSEQIVICLNDDLVQYEWVDINDLHKYKLTPPSIKLFKKLGYIENDI